MVWNAVTCLLGFSQDEEAQLSEEHHQVETEKGRISGQRSDKEVGRFYLHYEHNPHSLLFWLIQSVKNDLVLFKLIIYYE